MFLKEMSFKNIYKYSPFWFQNIMISIYGYTMHKQRFGIVYKRTFKGLTKKEYTNYEEEVSKQEEELQIFLRKVLQKSQFYRNLYKEIDISIIKKIEDLNILPIVNKELLRKNIDNVYSITEKDAVISYTGGTTGKSLKILINKNDFQKRMAYLDAFKYKNGIKNPLKIKKATFSGRDLSIGVKSKKFWRNNYFYNQRLYSTFDLTVDNLPYYIKNLNEYNPVVILNDSPKKEKILNVPIKVYSNYIVTPKSICISIGNNKNRKKIAELFNSNFPIFMHKSVVSYPSVSIGKGTVIMPNTVLDADSNIGEFCIINSNATVSHNVIIENFVHVAINVAIAGGVTIGEGVLLGAGSVILPNIEIGKWAIIGAGSIVTKNVPDYGTVYGNPAKIIKKNE